VVTGTIAGRNHHRVDGRSPKIEILHLVDRLEELVDHGSRVPLSRKIAIDEEMFLNIIDQMRITIPQEIRLAKEIQAERDKYVAQAHDEAGQVIAQAREDAARMLDEHQLRKEATVQAELILKRAREDAERIHAGADEYAETRLKELDQMLEQWRASIQNGLGMLAKRRTGTSPGTSPNS
jgi:hypothetical protein